MTSFQNKTVIVTGCSSGIGLQTALLFLARGASVFGIDIAPFAQELDESQTKAFSFHQVDLTQLGAPDEAVAACIAKFGPKIDVLANVAGIMDAFSSADTVQDAEYDRVIAINLTVPIKLMRAVLPSMKEHKNGAIVNVGSYASISGAAAGVAYTASKHGLAGATKNVAWRFHTEGIRANAVLPGGVPTNIAASMSRETWDQAAYEVLSPVQQLHTSFKRDDLPYGCIGANDIAEGIVFLASDAAKMINGVLMPIDNAWATI